MIEVAKSSCIWLSIRAMAKVGFTLGIGLFLSVGCVRKPVVLQGAYDEQKIPPAPDYSQPASWAALPERADEADRIPSRAPAGVADGQAAAPADVFFIHPTIYTYEPAPGAYPWNGDVRDADLNGRTDASTILNQASAFNGSCRVFAPRYRQAHYYSFLTPNTGDRRQALDLAYSDVRAAFAHYLKTYNRDQSGRPRPIVIASHSQGTMHAVRLIREFFDGQPLGKQLVVAYLIGTAVQPDAFRTIPPGTSAGQTGCFVSWNTFSEGYVPTYYRDGLHTAVCTNPLTWTITEGAYAPYAQNLGGVGLKFSFVPQVSDARVHRGLLWIGKPDVPGKALLRAKIWHRADINLFWMNLRTNVAERIRAYSAMNPAG